MRVPPDLSRLTRCSDMTGENSDERAELQAMLVEARAFLGGFEWCIDIKECYFAIGVGGIVAVFLFSIVPEGDDTDDWVWVVVGDLPPAYIDVDTCPTPVSALDGYIGAMWEWVGAVRGGRPVDDLIPVNAPSTREYAEMLASRLDFLDREILASYPDDVK